MASDLLFRHQLGRELRKARLQQGLTLGQMTYKSGVSRGYITEIEFGVKEPSSRVLAKLFEALDVYPVVSLHMRKVADEAQLCADRRPHLPDMQRQKTPAVPLKGRK